MLDLADPATLPRPRDARRRLSLGLIGCGAFGGFILPHLQRHFDLRLHDPACGTGSLADAARCEVVVLAVPLAEMRPVATAIAPHLRPGALVVDVCSVKLAPLAILEELLPPETRILGTHPLFGPQSGKHGIAGLRIALCPARGAPARLAACFLQRAFGLEVVLTTAEAHDHQMAYVQGLTHIIARSVLALDLPPLELRTTTFEHLMRMVDTVRHDSEALFRTIARDNPFATEVREGFARATAEVLERLGPS